IVLLLSGCSSQPLFYNEFLPPKDSKQVTIEVDVPQGYEIRPLNVMYRSDKCKVNRRVSEREYRDVPGFHNMEILLNQQGNTSIFAKEIPITGGGRCDWRLSNVTASLDFSKNHPLAHTAKTFIGRSLIFIFDTNSPKRSGGYINKVKGNLIISKKHFPKINKNSINNKLVLTLLGGSLYEYYDISQPQKIQWKPIVRNNIYVMTEYSGNAEKDKKGKQVKYSDGTVSQGDTDDEMYKKLLSMMEK
ncbi:MAG: hypothetical protein ACTH5W_20885, partial [Providencia sp.]|uniref:hypothetical protein n=1 Tax=Providencia sp. TaxID=589 RepID=UPI003F97F14D